LKNIDPSLRFAEFTLSAVEGGPEPVEGFRMTEITFFE